MVNEFIIPQKLSLWDYYRASLYLGIRNKRLRRLLYFIAIIGVLNLVLTLGLNTKPNNTTLIPVFQVLLPFLILVLFFFAGTFIICGLIKLLRPGIFKNMTYQFTHWGMYKKSDTIDHSIPWRNIIKVKETGSFIFLYISKDDAHVIQKKKFRHADELQSFKSFIDKYINRQQ